MKYWYNNSTYYMIYVYSHIVIQYMHIIFHMQNLEKHPLTSASFTWMHWNRFSFHHPFLVASTGAASGGSTTGGLVFRFFRPFFFIAMARWSTPLMGFKWWTMNEWNCCVVVDLSNWWMWLCLFLDWIFRWDKRGCHKVDFTRTSVKHVARMCQHLCWKQRGIGVSHSTIVTLNPSNSHQIQSPNAGIL